MRNIIRGGGSESGRLYCRDKPSGGRWVNGRITFVPVRRHLISIHTRGRPGSRSGRGMTSMKDTLETVSTRKRKTRTIELKMNGAVGIFLMR